MKNLIVVTAAVRILCACALIWMALQWRDALQATADARIDRIEAAIAAADPGAPAHQERQP